MNRLKPLPWRIGSSPEALEAMVRAIQRQDPPLVVCLDRREHRTATIQERLSASLTCAERDQLNRYRSPADRERFVLGRGCLRHWLGCWQHLAPETVELARGPHGKPHAPGGPEFNLSHSGDLILLALHPCQPVGVDVERLRPALHWEPIARRMLAPDQVQELLQLPATEQPLAFLQQWCELEATLKATGLGIAGATRGHQGPSLKQNQAVHPGKDRNPSQTLNQGESRNHAQWSTQSPHASEPQILDGPATGCRHWSLDLPADYRGCAVMLAPRSRRANLISGPDQRA